MTLFSLQVDDKIALKLPSFKDAEELFAVVDRNRNYLRQYLPWVDHNVSVNNTKAFIKECRKQFKNSSGFSLCIFYQGKIVGTIGLHYIDKVNRKTEIGYWISEDYQSKGIILKSCLALITYFFDKLKLHRIEIHCAIHNEASQRIPEKLRFTKEGVLRQATYLNGQFYDTFIYSLLSTEFNNGQQSE